jgi:hypothetical protein
MATVKSEQSHLLYTVQKPGFAITLRQPISSEFMDAGIAFHTMLFRMARNAGPDPWFQLANHLGWHFWISCFQNIKDFDNQWIALENLIRGDLWTLSVPYENIRWCSLEAQCENQLPVGKWLCSYPEVIRKHGQTPQALVKAPLLSSYLIKVENAETAFRNAGLWNDDLADATFETHTKAPAYDAIRHREKAA